MARGPLLLFTDDDVRVDAHWVAAYHDLFRRLPDTPIVCGGPIIPMPHDLGRWPLWFDDSALPEAGLLHHYEERVLRTGEYVWGGNMAIPKRVFDQFGLWDEDIGLQGDQRVTGGDSAFFEDTEFQDRVRNGGGAVWFCPAAMLHHRVNRGNVTPRRISSSAFARGRNAVWSSVVALTRDVRAAPKRNAPATLLALVGNLVRWTVALAIFRLSPGKGSFEQVRRAAFASGRALDSLRAGRRSARLYLAAARITFSARALLLRLTPDVS